MMENSHATLESQIGNAICAVEDTEEIFWLKMTDDYQSKVKCGDLLVRQYRFKDAIREYKNAMNIRQDDYTLYLKMGGAHLTLFDFEEAQNCYDSALIYGAKQESTAFYLGIKNFFAGNYIRAMECFEKTDVSSGEMLISVIYWHTISSFKAGTNPSFLNKYDPGAEVGHHTSYKRAVEVFLGQEETENISVQKSPLDAVIIFYAMYEYLLYQKKTDDAKKYLKQALEHKEVWPSIAYLAGYKESVKQQSKWDAN